MNTSPGYFDVFKIPILRGRDFKDSDVPVAPGVVLINEAMAKKYWPKGKSRRPADRHRQRRRPAV